MSKTISDSAISDSTAKIYQFPPRGRFAVSAAPDPAPAPAPATAGIAFGSSWYHEEAIREAEQPTRKH